MGFSLGKPSRSPAANQIETMKIHRIALLTLTLAASSITVSNAAPPDQGSPPPLKRRLLQDGAPGGGKAFGPGFENLTPEEREKLLAARQKVKDEPDVVAAREKMQQAAEEFRETLKAALLKADPTLGP